MSDQGPGGPQPPRENAPQQSPGTGGNQGRLGNPTRLVPRRTPPPVEAEPIDPVPLGVEPEPDPAMASRDMSGGLYPPATSRDLGRPRMQVVGLPGCLIISLVASVLLTLLLNIVF